MAPRYHWLTFYIAANIVGALIMSATGKLIGDAEGGRLYSQDALFSAVFLVSACYFLILGPVFNVISKIKVKAKNFIIDEVKIGKRIGILLFILQVAFMFFNLTTGANIAGSDLKIESMFSIVWVLIPVDILFIIYYGTYRTNRYFYLNAIVWFVSNFLRGWGGIYLFILFFEWCRGIRSKTITIFRASMILLVVLLTYPVLTSIKFLIRASGRENLSLNFILEEVANILLKQDYILLLGEGISHLIGRLQSTSQVVEVMRLNALLQSEFSHGRFAPFWLEGLHGITLNRLLNENYVPVTVAFTKYASTGWDNNVGDWNVNIGYPGWFIIAPNLILVYLLYTVFLGFISFYILKKIGISSLAKDMIWLAWLIFLLAPWFAAFVNFIYALFVFFLIKILMARLR